MLWYALRSHFLFYILVHFLSYFLFLFSILHFVFIFTSLPFLIIWYFVFICNNLLLHLLCYVDWKKKIDKKRYSWRNLEMISKITLFVCPFFRGGGSSSLGLSNWNLIFLSTHEKCRLLPTTSGRFLPKNFRVNHSGCLFSDRYLEVSSISNLQYWEVWL